MNFVNDVMEFVKSEFQLVWVSRMESDNKFDALFGLGSKKYPNPEIFIRC